MKPILTLMLCTTIFICKAGNNRNNVGADANIKEKSTFFKMSRNSNRMSIFEQLQSSIRVKTSKSNFAANNQQIPTQYSTYNDIIELLGNPNIVLKNSTIVYTLNPSSGCKAVIEFDANKEVVYVGVKDCF